jgi:hypothetical protein
MVNRIRNLDVGLERITQWEIGDEFHLPLEGKAAPAFLPQSRPLDEVLRRPSLDERLPDLLQPVDLDPGLLDPAALSATRQDLIAFFSRSARDARGKSADTLDRAARLLEADDGLDAEVRAALAALLRG